MPYNSKQQAVDALVPGAKIVGEKPYVVKVANPRAGLAGEPAQIDQVAGSTLSIQGADGTPDTITIKEVGNNDAVKGGVGYDVIEGPTKTPTKTSTPAAGLERLNARGDVIPPTDTTTPAVYVRDPKAPPGTQPFKLEEDQQLGDPKTWAVVYADPTGQDTSTPIGLYDPKSKKLAATIPASAGSKDSDPSGWSPVYRVPGDTKSGIVGQYDPVNKSLHPVAAAPDGKQIVTTNTGIYVVDKDTNKATLATTIDKSQPFQAVVTDGVRYQFDPNEKDTAKAFKRDPNQGPLPPTMKDPSGGADWVLQQDPNDPSGLGGHYVKAPGVTKAATVDAPGAAALEYIVYRDENGNEISRVKNPNYRPAQLQQGAQSLTARQIQEWNPKTGAWEWVDNKGRLVASDALKAMATQLTGQVVAGDISEDEATKLITAANAKMTNDIAAQQNVRGAAGDVLADVRGNATTGAGMLNQRVSSATGALNSMMSSMASSNMQNLPAGTGAQLVRGLGSWVTGLGGGDATYDAAARMVQAADPKVSGDPTVAQQATQALSQMFQEYQRQNGKPAPQVAATMAAQQSQQANGLVPPQTVAPTPQPTPVVQPANVASGQMAPPNQVPGQNYGNAVAYTGGIAPSQYGFTPPGGSSYSYGGPVPWAGAVPQPLPPGAPLPFIAPAMA